MTSPLADAIRSAFLECRDMDASLGERLDAFAASVRAISPPFAEAVDRLVEPSAEGGSGRRRAWRRRSSAAVLPARREGPHRLARRIAEGRAQSPSSSIAAIGARIAASTRERWRRPGRRSKRPAARSWRSSPIASNMRRSIRAEAEAGFPVLTDMDNGYAMSLNLVFWVGEEMRDIHVRGRPRPRRIPGQRFLDGAGTGDFRGRPGRPREGAFCRSGLSQAHDDREHAGGVSLLIISRPARGQSEARRRFISIDAAAERGRPSTPNR